MLIAGAIVGAIAGSGAEHVDALHWLAYSKSISISPSEINLVIIKLTFGFDFSMSVSQILFHDSGYCSLSEIFKNDRLISKFFTVSKIYKKYINIIHNFSSGIVVKGTVWWYNKFIA